MVVQHGVMYCNNDEKNALLAFTIPYIKSLLHYFCVSTGGSLWIKRKETKNEMTTKMKEREETTFTTFYMNCILCL